MQKIIKNLIDGAVKNLEERRSYFSDSTSDIVKGNLQRVRAFGAGLVALLVILIPLAHLVIAGFVPSWHYWFFFGISIVYEVLVELYAHNVKNPKYRVVQMLCIGYCGMVYACCIMLDVYPDPAGPASFLPVLFAVVPELFVLPYAVQIPMSLGTLVIYIFVVASNKPATVAQLDIFNAVFGALASAFILTMTMNLQVSEGNSKNRYKLLSTTDNLTGVTSRVACEKRIRKHLETRQSAALLMTDVDNFKIINDTMGHQVGDALLRSFGRELLCATNSRDIVGRLGGDEFMILLTGVNDEETLNGICRRILESGSLAGDILHNRKFSCSIGAVLVQEEFDYDKLYRAVDNALYEAKRGGKNRCVVRRA